ncbi:MAG: DEAD/DEAH box helicase [Desulfobacterales bacterium]|nr:DEAD/DEAH box helicase [Desulfobacterales bacterium]
MRIQTHLKLPEKEFDPAYRAVTDAYNALPLLHQTIVQILAVIYEGVARTHVVNALKKLDIKDIDTDDFTVKSVTPIFDELVDAGLIRKEYSKYQCSAFLAEPLCRQMVDASGPGGFFDEIAGAVQKVLSVKRQGEHYAFSSPGQMIREFRIGLYTGSEEKVYDILAGFQQSRFSYYRYPHPVRVIFKNSSDLDWFSGKLPHGLQADIAGMLVNDRLYNKDFIDSHLFSFLKDSLPSVDGKTAAKAGQDDQIDVGRILLVEQLILRGQLQEAKNRIDGIDTAEVVAFRGALAFLSGRNAAALSHYEEAFMRLKKSTRKRKIYFETLSGIFYVLALLKSGTPQHMMQGQNYTAIAADRSTYRFAPAYHKLNQLIAARDGNTDALEAIKEWEWVPKEEAVTRFLQVLVVYWTDRKRAGKFKKRLLELQRETEQYGYDWLAAELAVLVSHLTKTDKKYLQKPESFFDSSGINCIVNLFQPEDPWKRALNALMQLQKKASDGVEAGKSSRLAWFFNYSEKGKWWTLTPKEQVKQAKGGWSKGRKIALKRLYCEINSFDFLTAQDKRICGQIQESRHLVRGYPEVHYSIGAGALQALVGHPLVFSEDAPDVRVEFVEGKPELTVRQQSNGKFLIAFTHDISGGNDVQVIRETPNRFQVIPVNEDIGRIAKIIGKGVEVPPAGKKELLKAIDHVAPVVTVHSEIEGVGRKAEETPADPTPNIYLRPFGPGLKLEMRVQPFKADGPCFRPGESGETVIAEIGDKTLRTKRDLKQEIALADDAMAACPDLPSRGESEDGRWDWVLKQSEDCLEVLLAVKTIESSVIVKWPEGERFRIRRQADMNRLYLRVRKQKDWFAVSGELKVDSDLVLSMEELLSLLEETPGRFIPLKDGQFLALTEAFRKRLEELRTYSKPAGKNRLFHPLAALPLEAWADDFGGFQSDSHWKAQLKKVNDARSLQPQVPSTFKAELRDYQIEGYNWLARLAHWGVGACLADDMGLGKTIQALAIVLGRAAEGPSLVVAPTSVCMNWETESRRFAPTLSIVTLTNGDREKIMADLKPFDFLLVSYGLLQQEKVAEMLAKVRFETIVLDEAQAIKNLTTKRSQAAMNLNGGFKLITTGTPIENHLGELWNLFQFINPGFLGSFAEFNEKFAIPIEKHQDRNVRRRLKRLVQPFILRRTKHQVIEELPQRTNILLHVELSDEERAFYEALRQKALDNLDKEAGGNAGKSMHLRILAEIMKLRRACCNPQLVLPDTGLPSAKLSLFGEIVSELLENGHKALVFSQFTGHLDLIRQYVAEKGIAYQYLDGSTPQKERKKRVNAFQAGEGELFLISLKAGGLGLNLTAADYVIHMDPWWNPAVEDQAADRAHRIGQKRPVTVYNLVARQTIEEKIVALHRHKRDLADSLLDGADMSGKMSADELLRLIRDQ